LNCFNFSRTVKIYTKNLYFFDFALFDVLPPPLLALAEPPLAFAPESDFLFFDFAAEAGFVPFAFDEVFVSNFTEASAVLGFGDDFAAFELAAFELAVFDFGAALPLFGWAAASTRTSLTAFLALSITPGDELFLVVFFPPLFALLLFAFLAAGDADFLVSDFLFVGFLLTFFVGISFFLFFFLIKFLKAYSASI